MKDNKTIVDYNKYADDVASIYLKKADKEFYEKEKVILEKIVKDIVKKDSGNLLLDSIEYKYDDDFTDFWYVSISYRDINVEYIQELVELRENYLKEMVKKEKVILKRCIEDLDNFYKYLDTEGLLDTEKENVKHFSINDNMFYITNKSDLEYLLKTIYNKIVKKEFYKMDNKCLANDFRYSFDSLFEAYTIASFYLYDVNGRKYRNALNPNSDNLFNRYSEEAEYIKDTKNYKTRLLQGLLKKDKELHQNKLHLFSISSYSIIDLKRDLELYCNNFNITIPKNILEKFDIKDDDYTDIHKNEIETTQYSIEKYEKNNNNGLFSESDYNYKNTGENERFHEYGYFYYTVKDKTLKTQLELIEDVLTKHYNFTKKERKQLVKEIEIKALF